MIKAYKIEACGIVGVAFAERRALAVSWAFRNARDAGFEIRFPDIRATRWPEWDDMAIAARAGRCWTPDRDIIRCYCPDEDPA